MGENKFIMNDNNYIGIFLMCSMFFVLGVMLSYWYYIDVDYDVDCLINISKEYCENNNTEYHSLVGTFAFTCLEDPVNLRISNVKIKHTYYFLPEEKQSCIIKESQTWRNIK